ncbi:MAG: TfoX/Sxy family protein [Paracoccaceae bacterium]
MAYDPGIAEILRDALAGEPITEKRMFGGIAFMYDGNMVCGVHKNGAMFRVGKENEPAARALPGVADMTFTGKPMKSMVDVAPETLADEALLGQLVTLSLGFVKSLPPK